MIDVISYLLFRQQIKDFVIIINYGVIFLENIVFFLGYYI